MSRASSIDALPEELRAEIGRLRTQGCTLDRILEHLRSLHGEAPSRSALGRHVQKLDKIGDRLRRSRTVAEALARELGDAPASKTAQMNIELMHGFLFDVFERAADGAEGIDEGGKAALGGNPVGAMMLAKALDHLTSASKKDADYRADIEKRMAERMKKAAVAAAEAVGREKGLSADTVSSICASILGIKAAP